MLYANNKFASPTDDAPLALEARGAPIGAKQSEGMKLPG